MFRKLINLFYDTNSCSVTVTPDYNDHYSAYIGFMVSEKDVDKLIEDMSDLRFIPNISVNIEDPKTYKYYEGSWFLKKEFERNKAADWSDMYCVGLEIAKSILAVKRTNFNKFTHTKEETANWVKNNLACPEFIDFSTLPLDTIYCHDGYHIPDYSYPLHLIGELQTANLIIFFHHKT